MNEMLHFCKVHLLLLLRTETSEFSVQYYIISGVLQIYTAEVLFHL